MLFLFSQIYVKRNNLNVPRHKTLLTTQNYLIKFITNIFDFKHCKTLLLRKRQQKWTRVKTKKVRTPNGCQLWFSSGKTSTFIQHCSNHSHCGTQKCKQRVFLVLFGRIKIIKRKMER